MVTYLSNTQFLLSASLNYPPSCFARKISWRHISCRRNTTIQSHHDSVTGFAGIIFRSVFQEVRKLGLTQSLSLAWLPQSWVLRLLSSLLPKLISWCISCWGCKRNYKRIFVCQRNWTTDCVGAKKVCFLSMRSSCRILNCKYVYSEKAGIHIICPL